MLKKSALLVLMIGLVLSLAPTLTFADYSYNVSAVEVIKAVNFRTGPSANYKSLRFLQPGEVLEVVSQPNSSWFEATDSRGVTAFVSSSSTYVKKTTKKVFPEPNATVVASVNFRTGPSTDSSQIRFLKKGEYVWILEQMNAYWYKVADADNKIGYVSTSDKYLDTSFGEVVESEEETYIDEPNATILKSVNFRTGPSTDASPIRFLKAGESIWILDKPNSFWYQAKDKNGVIGYVSTSSTYLTTTYTDDWKKLDTSIAVEKIIEAGLKYLGTPYEFGSSRSDTSTFDCSDFVRQAFLDGTGIKLPGDSRQQASYVLDKQGSKIVTDWRQLKRGDLMFFMAYKGMKASDYAGIDRMTTTVTHVGIYLGNGEVLHTYSVASGGVRTNVIADSQWENRFLYGGSAF